MVCQPATGSARSQEFLGEVWVVVYKEITQPYVQSHLVLLGGPSDPQLLVASVRITLFIEEPSQLMG